MLECKQYSLTEIKKLLSISKRTWETRKEELLEYMDKFFNYEIIKDGRNTYFIIYEQFSEYVPLPPKKDAEKIKAYYHEETCKFIEKDPWNTGSNIARNIIANDEQLYSHKTDTIARYVRPIIREEFVHDYTDTAWMRLDGSKLNYIHLTEEELGYLNELFVKYSSKESKQQMQLEKYSEYESGYITKEELADFLMNQVKSNYCAIMADFMDKYGFRPQKIKYLEQKVF